MAEFQIEVDDPEGLGQEILMKIASQIFSASQENLTANKTVDTGALLKSGRITKIKDGVRIIYDAKYADCVEYGTGPHPMYSGWLLKWAKRKFGVSEKKARAIAWAVAKTIEKEGMNPHPFMRPAVVKVLGGGI